MIRFLMTLFALLLSPLALAAPIDINSADIETLDTLPGIGPAKARAIIDYRTQNGPFAATGDIVNVSGIGPATYANIRALISVDGEAGGAPTPQEPATDGPPNASAVNVNTASAAELETLPGIGPTKAKAIVENRSQNGAFTSCGELVRVPGIGPATVANIGTACTTTQ